VKALRGEGTAELNILGVRAGEKSIKDMIEAFVLRLSVKTWHLCLIKSRS